MRTIEDCINDLVCDIENFIGGNITDRQNELLNEIIEIHKTEKRPKGKWIPMKKAEENPFYIKYQCSECGCLILGGKDNYCPNCGADMRESEVKNNAVGSKQFEPCGAD